MSCLFSVYSATTIQSNMEQPVPSAVCYILFLGFIVKFGTLLFAYDLTSAQLGDIRV